MHLRRFLYLPYYLLKTKWRLVFRYSRFVKREKKISYPKQIREVIYTMIKHNAAPIDYYSYRFYELPKREWGLFPCMGFMYEFQLRMNPPEARIVLHDKIKFLEKFDTLSGRKWASLDYLKRDRKFAENFYNTACSKIVLKKSTGGAGKQVEVIDGKKYSLESMLHFMDTEGFNLAEHYIVQHDELMRLSPAAVNTIRIVTQFLGDRAVILLSFIRVSVDADVDNLSINDFGKNFGASIDLESGEIKNPGIYLDITKPKVFEHPITKVPVIGFKIPYWNECKTLAIQAAELTPENRSIGWDIAITNDGPVLVEGNHNWSLLSMVIGSEKLKNDFKLYLNSLKKK